MPYDFPGVHIVRERHKFLGLFWRWRTVYILKQDVIYLDPKTGKLITVPKGTRLDGASGLASDIVSIAWIIHDWIVGCELTGVVGHWAFDDGTPITTAESVRIFGDILTSDGQTLRDGPWSKLVRWFGPRSPHDRK